MSSRTKPEAVSLSRIIGVVEGHTQTLSLYNVEAAADVVADIRRHFTPTSVDVRVRETDDGYPRNFAVLHDETEFLAASGLLELHRAVDPTGWVMDDDQPRSAYPDLLQKTEQSVFTEYGKRRMILASREIEKGAWDDGPLTLHVGFQEFSRLRSQRSLYRKLTDRLDIHLYGAPDRKPAVEPLTYHGYDDHEIRNSWFVVVEPDDDYPAIRPRALLAEEREPNVYSGFWTSHEPIIDRILARLETYPANSPF